MNLWCAYISSIQSVNGVFHLFRDDPCSVQRCPVHHDNVQAGIAGACGQVLRSEIQKQGGLPHHDSCCLC